MGKRGYIIRKSYLTQEQINEVKRELTVKPFVQADYGAGDTNEPFPIYLENENKLYVPKFYGVEKFGPAQLNTVPPGKDIELNFSLKLKPEQQAPADATVKAYHEQGGGILSLPCGFGKTILALYFISQIKKKTLVVVHKEFLMNQWVERIQEFLPSAKVGKIQGTIMDVAGKDIVIGMIQTIYDKEFPANFFSCFGLTIVDEVHRIGSEQFSRTLLKTITPYMLGISATVDRKDGLTKVLYMFIGDKIYSEERKQEDFVSVRAIEYKTNDHGFNETEVDFKGTPQFSKMIVKLCEYGPRSDFIIRIIRDLIQENPENQIMILGHNRSLLTYLHDGIVHRNIGSVGYYVGGMKESALKETETKQIVVATYSMAAEALDIKTLSTLVMVTPKTDIIQSVGRILRMKHDNPIIVDIVDTHDLFQNQWAKRRAYYKKCNYYIHKVDSNNYYGMAIDWDKDRKWKRVFIPKTNGKCDSLKITSTNSQLDSDEEIKPEKSRFGGCVISFEGMNLEDEEK